LKTLTSSKHFTESCIAILFPFSVIDPFSPVSTPHWLQEKSVILHVIGGYVELIFRITGGFQNHFKNPGGFVHGHWAGISLKRVTNLIFRIAVASVFIEAGQKFRYDYLNSKAAKNLETTSEHTEGKYY
jgi:hypothetical protein